MCSLDLETLIQNDMQVKITGVANINYNKGYYLGLI